MTAALALAVVSTLVVGGTLAAASGPGELPGRDAGRSSGWERPVPGALLRAFEPPAARWTAGHRGVDLAAGEGEVVTSPADGTVTFAGRVAGKPVVVVAHAGGLRSTFEPATTSTPRGTGVRAGEPVARLGGEGAAASHCGPAACLHWGVLRGDAYLDPMALLGEDAPIVLLPASAG